MSKIFCDENSFYKFNFSKSLWATNKLHDNYLNIDFGLCDVDFIVESVDEIYLIEYKNANIEEAEFPESFEPFSQTKINNIAKKYFDSLVYVKALCEKEICNYKPCVFIYILEYPNGDDSSRRELRNILRFGNDSRKGKRKYYLPFVIQKRGGLGNKLIERVEVLSINEWNIKYPHYPITEITKER